MKRLLLRIEVLVVLIVAVCLALLAASSDAPARPDLKLTSGPGDTLTLSNSREGSAILSLGGIRPGDSVTDTVTLGNTGTIPGDISLEASNLVDTPGTGGGALSGELDLLIRDVTNAGSPSTVYTGKIPDLTALALGSLAAGTSRVYEFTVSFPDTGPGAENAYQGSSMSVQFDWTAFNPSSGDTTPPETILDSGPPALSASADATFTFSADEAGSTFECALNGGAWGGCTSPDSYTGLADGAHTFEVRAIDDATNTDPTPAKHAWTVDATAPSVSLADPGARLRGTVTLSPSADDGGGSGVATLVVQRSPAGAGNWTNVGLNWNTTNVVDGAYDLRARATDNAGNPATSVVRTVNVDNTAPGLSSSTPADGEVVASAASLSLAANETLAEVEATIDGAAAAPALAGATATFAGPFTDQPHTLEADLVDLAGNRRHVLVHFTVWGLATADYPWVEKNSYASASTTLTAADDKAEIRVPSGAWTGAPSGDWLVVRIDPRPAAGDSDGFQPAGDIYDVTAYWALDGSAVDTFSKALDLTIGGAAANAVPATFQGGEWRAIPLVPNQTLPAGWDDGYYLDGTDVHVLTEHLSWFTLLEDVEAPSKPKAFSGSRKNGRLVLEWKAASDNAAVDAYLVYAKGALVKTLGAAARSAGMGRYRASDARSFQVAARDVAGNVGAKTRALVIVPRVRNLTLVDARARVTARGLGAGTVSYAYSAAIASGRVIEGTPSGLVAKGTAISLRVSRGAAPRTPTTTPATPPPPYTPPPSSSGTPPTFPSGAAGHSTPSATGTPSSPSSPGTPEPPANTDPSTDPDEIQPESFAPGNDESDASGLRRLLGLALLGGAFLAAGAVALRARGPRMPKGPEGAIVEPLMFWDQRLARTVSAALRRLVARA
jgi:hypothetical protein